MTNPSPPIALTVAGSDCSAGAGLQADLKTFSAHGVFGMTAITCAVSESSLEVEAIEPLPPTFLSSQVKLILRSYPVTAIKTGMLYSKDHINAFLDAIKGNLQPLVVDPVMISGTGTRLIKADAINLYREALLPIATLATPNLDEACLLLNTKKPETIDDLIRTARKLTQHFGCAFLLKGGHMPGPEAIDILAETNGNTQTFQSQRINIPSTHGTGCTYSAAITANLAHGKSLHQSINNAKHFITTAISQSAKWQNKKGDPLYALDQIQA